MEDMLNTEFCKEVGIKQAACYIVNPDTNEIRFYSNLSGLYKKPAGWKKVEAYKFDIPKYPDLITNPFNFSLLINVQWFMWRELGNVYTQEGKETFEYNYVKKRLEAMKMARSFGGGDKLDEYKDTIRNLPFDYFDLMENKNEG